LPPGAGIAIGGEEVAEAAMHRDAGPHDPAAVSGIRRESTKPRKRNPPARSQPASLSASGWPENGSLTAQQDRRWRPSEEVSPLQWIGANSEPCRWPGAHLDPEHTARMPRSSPPRIHPRTVRAPERPPD
jgi:hypothetical protein